ncbi:hypothetical protein MASR2M29_24110 [Spirochaetota bacterium]
MKNASIQLETLTCPTCIKKIEAALKSLDGIKPESTSVSFNTSKAKFEFDETKLSIEDIEKSITKIGYEVLKSKVN